MKICFFTHNLRQDNGAGVFSRRLIMGLREHLQSEVVVFVWEKSGEPFETCLPKSKFALIKELYKIRRIVKECDVVHALDAYPYAVLASLLLFGSRKSFLITAVGSGSISQLYKWPHSFFLKWAYKKADRIIAISNFTMNEVQKCMPKLKISVINHGVDRIPYGSNKASPHFRDSILKFKPYILSVGSLRFRKGYHLSIKAFALLAWQFPSLNYVIVGKEYQKEYELELKELIKELHLEGRVHLLKNIDNNSELNMIYKEAELFFLMSQNRDHNVEGFGLVFLEAARAGLPVVGSKNCGVEDAMIEGKNGLLANETSPKEFSLAISNILKDNVLREKMSEESCKFAEVSNWESRIPQYVKIYSSLNASR